MRPWILLAGLVLGCAPDHELFDVDGDGAYSIANGGTDCDDTNQAISPDVEEICFNEIDDDCNGVVDDIGVGEREWYGDLDGDGWGSLRVRHWSCVAPEGFVRRDGDCDDTNDTISPTGIEICGNLIDEDCSGLADDTGPFILWYPDADGDGFGSPLHAINQCTVPFGRVTNNIDCDDRNPAVRPDATDWPGDQIDLNCDGFDD